MGQGAKDMMVITRLYPENASVNLWDPILSGLKNCIVKGITPLYVSQRDDRSFTSIVSETETPDAVVELLDCNELKLRAIRRSRTIVLAKPMFFPTPPSGKKMRRYHFSIHVKLAEVRGVHQTLRKAKPTPDAGLAYLACAFGEEELVGSLVASDYDRAKAFLMENIGNLASVMGFTISRVGYSKRLVNDKTWKAIINKYPHAATDAIAKAKDMDWTLVENALITGAFKGELGPGC